MNQDTTYIVLLNWNGWRDTVACLDSIFGLRNSRFRVVVCDNDSSDNSLHHIRAWCRGKTAAEQPGDARLRALVSGQKLERPCLSLTASQIAAGTFYDSGEPVILIDNEANLGFAAGNNTGLRYALGQDDMSHVWLLNNDTLVEPDSLSAMLKRLERESASAACGSMIHFFDNPALIQAIGGNRFNPRTGVARQSEGRFLPEHQLPDIADIENTLDYLSGCSILLPAALLKRVGLLNESYFLYYEEIDWFSRAGTGVKRCVAEDARIYHREGGSIGSPSLRNARPSLVADFHIFRSKHMFMQAFYPENLFSCYLSSALEVAKRVLRGQFRNARVVLAAMFGAKSLPG